MPWGTEKHIVSEAFSIEVALLPTRNNNTDKSFLTFECNLQSASAVDESRLQGDQR